MLMPEDKLRALVDRRDACSGGGAEKCAICGNRHGCNLDEAGEAASTALRYAAALAEYVVADMKGENDFYAARRVSKRLLEDGKVLEK